MTPNRVAIMISSCLLLSFSPMAKNATTMTKSGKVLLSNEATAICRYYKPEITK